MAPILLSVRNVDFGLMQYKYFELNMVAWIWKVEFSVASN